MDIPRDWTFERASVAGAFDAHVREQLPWYDLTTGAVAHIARHYIPRGGLVYDIGASTGNMGRAIEATLNDRDARLVAIEASDAMCKLYDGPQAGRLVNADALTFEYEPFDLAICYLVLMFMPVAERAAFVRRLAATTRPGGALVIVDKVRAEAGYAATVLWRMTLAGKLAAGTDASEIVAKELSLCGVQRPLDRSELPNGAVEWFRFGEFAGWLIEA